MVKNRSKKKVIKSDVVHDDAEIEYQDEYSSRISSNRLRNEWDTDGEFADMDFRLVDDD